LNRDRRLPRLWRSRDELSLRNIRFGQWNIVLLYAVGIIMGDVRLLDLEGDAFGIDAFTLELVVYGIASLIFAFLPRKYILPIARLGAPLMLLALVLELACGRQEWLPLYLLYSFGDGVCLGGAMYLFFFKLNHSERLLNLIVISIYYLVCVDIIWDYFRWFFINVTPYFLIAFFCVSIFRVRHADEPEPAGDKGCPNCANDCLSDDDSGSNPVGRQGMAAVFYCYFAYMIIDILYVYLVFSSDVVSDNAFVVGSAIGIAVCIVMQLLMNRSVWLTWNTFLLGSVLSIALLAIDTPVAVIFGSAIYGGAGEIGYIAVIYLVAGAAFLSGCMLYYRAFCIVLFVCYALLEPALEKLFGWFYDAYGSYFNVLALALIVVLVCVTSVVYPIMNRRIFSADWVSDMLPFDSGRFKDEVHVVETVAGQKDLGLTPREKQVFTLLLTDLPQKGIVAELKISRGTFNFHIANLYRKLGIQSRQELTARFGGRDI
jgi:DNA-binding CsgD family transcriptional regulator